MPPSAGYNQPPITPLTGGRPAGGPCFSTAERPSAVSIRLIRSLWERLCRRDIKRQGVAQIRLRPSRRPTLEALEGREPPLALVNPLSGIGAFALALPAALERIAESADYGAEHIA